ncbi:energy transducer TonB family protein [Tenacibaculum piscium]|uniref:energy transducer TonB family protein n=1 Tax=Tenacibaculum piscium TaxID=1458515 RepID=UPI001F405CE8|nr:energy transducer TonB [Tenacibaculum piscium]
MKILETAHKRKSAIITALILMLLLFGIFNFGMKYLDPPIEYGLAINFGDAEVGSGEPVENTKSETTAQSEQEIEDEIQEDSEEDLQEVEEDLQEIMEASDEIITDDIITDQTKKDVPTVDKSVEKEKLSAEKTTKTPQKKTAKKTNQKENKKENKKDVKKITPKPSKQTTDALNSLLGGTSKNAKAKGEGDDTQSGTKGNKNGDPNSSKYYGNSGSGSGGNYNLAGRKALSKPIKKPDCQEEGTIVVSIEVDQNGKVIKAQTGGLKGSTSSAPCLEKAAKQAALKTKWNADQNAPQKQRGTIIYKFSLSQ